MQLGKAAGFAMGWKLRGDQLCPIAVAALETGRPRSDFHEAMSAAPLWDLPVLFLVTDNEIAISVPQDEESDCRPGKFAGGYGVRSQAAKAVTLRCVPGGRLGLPVGSGNQSPFVLHV